MGAPAGARVREQSILEVSLRKVGRVRLNEVVSLCGRRRIAPLVMLVVSVWSTPAVAGPRADFEKLEWDIEDAESDVETRGLISRMDGLVEATLGQPDGPYIAIQTCLYASYLGNDQVLPRFELVVKHYPNAPELIDAFEYIEKFAWESEHPERWTKSFDGLAQASKLKKVRSLAVHASGGALLAAGKLKDAESTFDRLVKADPTSDQGKSATGFLFEIRHLQIGMVAPDFTATTLDGKAVSLAGLRGKTVFLNFWATW